MKYPSKESVDWTESIKKIKKKIIQAKNTWVKQESFTSPWLWQACFPHLLCFIATGFSKHNHKQHRKQSRNSRSLTEYEFNRNVNIDSTSNTTPTFKRVTWCFIPQLCWTSTPSYQDSSHSEREERSRLVHLAFPPQITLPILILPVHPMTNSLKCYISFQLWFNIFFTVASFSPVAVFCVISILNGKVRVNPSGENKVMLTLAPVPSPCLSQGEPSQLLQGAICAGHL